MRSYSIIDLMTGDSGDVFLGNVTWGIVYPGLFVLTVSVIVACFARRFPLQSNMAIALNALGYSVHVSCLYEGVTYRGDCNNVSLLTLAGVYLLVSVAFTLYCFFTSHRKVSNLLMQLVMVAGSWVINILVFRMLFVMAG
jgi:hypothetical protein